MKRTRRCFNASGWGQSIALKVISRTSVMQYKDAKQSLPAIGRALQVDAIVEGSVRRSGDRVGITVQLIRASTDAHICLGASRVDS